MSWSLERMTWVTDTLNFGGDKIQSFSEDENTCKGKLATMIFIDHSVIEFLDNILAILNSL